MASLATTLAADWSRTGARIVGGSGVHTKRVDDGVHTKRVDDGVHTKEGR